MASPFIGQIMMFAGTFVPDGYLACDGSLKQISQFDALFALIGTTYGGDGVQTFAVPNLSARAPMHQGTLQGGSTYVIGFQGGAATVPLNTDQLGGHSHDVLVVSGASGGAAAPGPQQLVADEIMNPGTAYVAPTQANLTVMAQSSIGPTGGGQPHANVQPVLAITICMAAFGAFPT